MYAEAFISIDSSPSSGLCFSDILLVQGKQDGVAFNLALTEFP